MSASGMNTIRELSHACGSFPSDKDLLMIFESQFIVISPACCICAGMITSGPANF